MTGFRGYYINLSRDKLRKEKLLKHLKQLGQDKNYKRLDAQLGDDAEKERRGLKKGEHGIWRSWINLLDDIAKESTDELIHVMEDDAILSTELYNFIGRLSAKKIRADIICTDMYVNPSVYKTLSPLCPKHGSNEITAIEVYTGCLSSCILTEDGARKLREYVKDEFKNGDSLIPIDNYIRRLQSEKKIKIITILPFLTTVNIESITESSIQERENLDKTVNETQIFCTYLRRQLSIHHSHEDIHFALESLIRIIKYRGLSTLENERFLISLTEYLFEHDILVYAKDRRLEGEKENPQ